MTKLERFSPRQSSSHCLIIREGLTLTLKHWLLSR